MWWLQMQGNKMYVFQNIIQYFPQKFYLRTVKNDLVINIAL